MSEFQIPKPGGYFHAGGVRYHIQTKGEKVILRLVDHPIMGTPALHVTMPAGNQVEIFPEPHDKETSE